MCVTTRFDLSAEKNTIIAFRYSASDDALDENEELLVYNGDTASADELTNWLRTVIFPVYGISDWK